MKTKCTRPERKAIKNMKKIYIVRREDAFKIGFPQSVIMEAGSIWMTVALTDSEHASYPYPISDY